jgi:hypothetical protein
VTSTDGTAGGDDYRPAEGYLVFQPGETRKTFRVFVNDDARIEERETVQLDLRLVGDPTGLIPTDQVGDPTGLIPTDQVGDPTGLIPTDQVGDPTGVGDPAGLMPTDQATLHIVSDDAWRPGTFQFDASSVTFDEAAGTATLTVQRVGGSSGEASLNFATESFTPPRQATWIKRHTELLYPTDRDTPATAGADYVAQHGTLNFADGETSKTITVPLVNDDWFEGGEAFVVALSEPTAGATLGGQAQIKVRIESEDAKQPGRFQFTTDLTSVNEGGGHVNVTIERTGGGNVEASVRLNVSGGGAMYNVYPAAWQPNDFGDVPATVTFAAGEMSKTIAIPIVDDAQVETTEAFTVTMSGPSNDATLGSQSMTTVEIVDNESAFEWDSGGSLSVDENAGTASVTIVRKGSTAAAGSVSYSTYDLSALAGSDYAPVQGTVSFGAGESAKIVTIPITNDPLAEPNESFGIQLSSPTGGATLGSYVWGSVTIVNDDVAAAPGQLSLAAAAFQVSEGAGALLVTIQRTGGSDGTVTVDYETSDGATGYAYNLTAWAGADYTSTKGTLTFGPGVTAKTFSIPIASDARTERDEVFTVKLKKAAGGATLGAVAQAVVTIREDDSAFEFSGGNVTVNEGAGVAYVTIVRKGSTAGAASVDAALTGYSASPGSDFTIPNLTISFADGESSKTLQVNLVDDALAEGTEWLGLTLKKPVGGTLGSSLWTYLTIADSDDTARG